MIGMDLIVDNGDRICGVSRFRRGTVCDGVIVTFTIAPEAITVEVMDTEIVLGIWFEAAENSREINDICHIDLPLAGVLQDHYLEKVRCPEDWLVMCTT